MPGLAKMANVLKAMHSKKLMVSKSRHVTYQNDHNGELDRMILFVFDDNIFCSAASGRSCRKSLNFAWSVPGKFWTKRMPEPDRLGKLSRSSC